MLDSGGRQLELEYAQVGLKEKIARAYLVSDTLGQRLLLAQEFDEYGRATNKNDQAGTEILRFKFDPGGRLTNRWSSLREARLPGSSDVRPRHFG